MKQIICISILLFACCFAVSAQANENINILRDTEPNLLAEFNDSDNEWYKITMEILGREFVNDLSAIGLIRIRNDKNFGQRLKLVKTGLRFYRIDLSRINLLIVNEQKDDTNVLILHKCSEMPKCENCIVIRAMDIDKIENLFKPRTATKKRKN